MLAGGRFGFVFGVVLMILPLADRCSIAKSIEVTLSQ